MAENTIKVVSFANLQSYDTLIKKYIGDADKVVDAKSVKNVAVVGDSIYFFKQDTIPTTEEGAVDVSKASASVAISSSDVAKLLTDVAELQGTVAGYSSTSTVASAIAAAQKAAEDHADAQVKDLAEGAVATNTAAIASINNTETGILKQAKDYTDALANGQVKTNKEAIESITDTTTGILKQAKDYTDAEVKKVTDEIGTVAEGETVVSLIADAKKAGTDAAAELTSYKTTNDAAVKAAQDAADAAQDDVDALEDVVGDMDAVKTTAKTVASAIDELKDAIDTTGNAGKVTMTEAAGSGDVLKTYTFYQGGESEDKKIGTISLAKDLVVTSGEVVVNPEGQPAGTYIKLTIANQETPIFINVKDLVEDFTVAKDAVEVQLAVSETREISATLVDGGVDAKKLADGAVTTGKIAAENVTKEKLSKAVQASLDAADAAAGAITDAIEALDYTTAATGDYVASITEADGIIAPVYGTFNFDEKGAAAQALADAKQYADDLYEIATANDINGLFADQTV